MRYPPGVIVVIGEHLGSTGPGLAFATAAAAARAGALVQAVGLVPEGPVGDRVVLELATVGVGHAAVLRSADRAMEAADLELALRYLPETRVMVLDSGTGPLVRAAADGAAWAGATLVVLAHGAPGEALAGLPDTAIVLDAPDRDPDGAFAGFVGDLAARLDAGGDPRAAWDGAGSAKAVDAVSRPGR